MAVDVAASREPKQKMSWSSNQSLFFILIYVGFLQALLLIYDAFHPEIFLNADRAFDRMKEIENLVSFFQGKLSLPQFLDHQGTLQGVPGDYLIQGALFYLGGQYAVILFQILLFIVSVAALYKLTLLVTNSSNMSFAAAAIYAHLPYGMVFSHMLWADALFNPFVLISFYFAARSAIRDPRWTDIGLAALFLGLATLVRPSSILWSIVVIATFALCLVPLRRIIGYSAVFIVVLVAWPSFIWLQTGNFKMGRDPTGAHIARNISLRLKHMVEILPAHEREEAERRFLAAQKSNEPLSDVASRYLHFSLTYPGSFAKQLVQDGVVFVAQSGIERLAIDYFELTGGDRQIIQHFEQGWRRKMAENGVLQTLLTFNPTILMPSLICTLAIFLLWGFAGAGAIFVFREGAASFGPRENILLLSMALFPLYNFLPGVLMHYPAARYRSPAEFCLCILAVIGWRATMSLWNRPAVGLQR